ncbi:MAG: biotin transporter BioY [Oscillospiraceae bacterium]|nr:biotin transporter BioY [Oscillospiraceae bacterium]
MKAGKISSAALLAALICVLAPWSVAIGPVPLTLASLAVCFVAAVSEPKKACLAVFIYIALGAVGLPVFSGFTGGLYKLAGPTGGYIIGYLPCALAVSHINSIHKKSRLAAQKRVLSPSEGRENTENKTRSSGAFKSRLVCFSSMLLGTALCYAAGTAWFIVQTQTPLHEALLLCVLPFLPGDLLKAAAASYLAGLLGPRLEKARAREKTRQG